LTFSAPQVLVLDVVLGEHLLQLMRHLLRLPTGQGRRRGRQVSMRGVQRGGSDRGAPGRQLPPGGPRPGRAG